MNDISYKCSVIVYTGSYMDSLFITHYLSRAGIHSVSRSSIKGTDKFISHNTFPGTSILVSEYDKQCAESLIREYYDDLYS